ncbi:hypothetical protein JMN32_13760 [Fulvivirga sp. 29W222]|uniref:Uncharacterized protein n=1 Tax=Fulvivirga marina TaxID=2494733 RepID=A0A937KEP4_9BACT|nr:hypothetical protein [Fulvivirga marina]
MQLFLSNGIEYKLVEVGSPVDTTFGGGAQAVVHEIKIYQRDFEKARNILSAHAEVMMLNVDKTHYLFDFTNEELYDVLLKPDEWSELDHMLSTKILRDRGENISKDLIASLKTQRLADLTEPEASQMGWVYAGYFFSLIGGLLGLLMGWQIWNGTKTLPGGKKVYSYCHSDRKHGRNIFLIGLVIFPVVIISSLLS